MMPGGRLLRASVALQLLKGRGALAQMSSPPPCSSEQLQAGADRAMASCCPVRI
jgi:hypothetical protein